MNNSKTLFQDFVNRITLQESSDEINSIAYLAFENIFGLTKAQILAGKEITETSFITRLDDVIRRINQHEPIQYILGEAQFYGRAFVVNPSVLIPRPETEELVRLVLNFTKTTANKKYKILDIGTGSGCIAATLSLELPHAEVFATDISEEALNVASLNARKVGAKIQFQQHDVLKDRLPLSVDIIVSNPPYIASHERAVMPRNVVEHEPSIALFVGSDDALLFYKALVLRADESLSIGGLLAVEINERFGREVDQLFKEYNFQEVELLKDVYGKDRIVKGVLSS